MEGREERKEGRKEGRTEGWGEMKVMEERKEREEGRTGRDERNGRKGREGTRHHLEVPQLAAAFAESPRHEGTVTRGAHPRTRIPLCELSARRKEEGGAKKITTRASGKAGREGRGGGAHYKAFVGQGVNMRSVQRWTA
jgi:hypothetical protein